LPNGKSPRPHVERVTGEVSRSFHVGHGASWRVPNSRRMVEGGDDSVGGPKAKKVLLARRYSSEVGPPVRRVAANQIDSKGECNMELEPAARPALALPCALTGISDSQSRNPHTRARGSPYIGSEFGRWVRHRGHVSVRSQPNVTKPFKGVHCAPYQHAQGDFAAPSVDTTSSTNPNSHGPLRVDISNGEPMAAADLSYLCPCVAQALV
jgi:hypothetical protein